MNLKLKNVVVATTGALFFGFGANAMADSTFDLVQALVAKGILTEEEALPLLKGREADIKIADEKVKKKAKVGISDAIDNATVYGDVRARYEYRDGTGVATSATGVNVKENRNRPRYKVTLGVKTETGDWYTDLALAAGATGRSDNVTLGATATGGDIDNKTGINIKRAMIGWKATDWLTLEAGRMNNPLYTTPMVWDADLNFEGLAEKVNYKYNDFDLFFTAAQSQYQGDRQNFTGPVGATPPDTITTELFAFQGGGKYAFNDHTNAKAGLTYTTYSHGTSTAKYSPQLATSTSATVLGPSSSAVNDLDLIEIPAEFNYYWNANSIGVKVFGDYAFNTSGSDRYNAAVLATPAGATRNKISAAGNDDTAWMLGLAVGSAADFKSFDGGKMVKGDWSARIWYQDVGAYSVDPNTPDSDFFDSRVNMKGAVLKAQYNFLDNVFANLSYGHATRKNNALGSTGSSATRDINLNLKDFDLLQLDLNYKF